MKVSVESSIEELGHTSAIEELGHTSATEQRIQVALVNLTNTAMGIAREPAARRYLAIEADGEDFRVERCTLQFTSFKVYVLLCQNKVRKLRKGS